MATVEHFIICVPRQNRAELPVSPEDSGVFRYLTEKTYLRKYFKVFCVKCRNYGYVWHLTRLAFKNGVCFRDVPPMYYPTLTLSPFLTLIFWISAKLLCFVVIWTLAKILSLT